MKLAAEIERNGEPVSVEVDTGLAEPADTYRVITLVGSKPLQQLAQGTWNPDAARAIVYVNVIRALADGEPDWDHPPFTFDEMNLDWGEMTPYMDPNPEMESALAELSEDI